MILAGAIGIPPTADQRTARAQCSIPNPRREQYERHCRGKGRPPPPAMLDVSHKVSGWLLCPRHFPGASGTAQDRRTLPPSEPRRLGWTLRPYQRAALDAWVATDGDGVVVAPCGAGKTLIGCAALAAVHTPAVVLVHTRDLATQWIERIGEAMPGVEVGEVRHGKDEREADVVVATLQSLTRWDWAELVAWGRGRGLVVVDECHHIPAQTFARVMMGLAGRYRLGLTATPERADGLTQLIHWTLGDTVHEVQRDDLQSAGHVLTPQIRVIQTRFAPDAGQVHERRRQLAQDQDRNELLVGEVLALAKERRRVLVLVDLVEHARTLEIALTLQGCEARALVGKMTAKQRRAVLLDLERGAVSAVIATSLADEGLDVPSLDACVLATPCGNVGRVEQRIGRVLRPSDGKRRPVVLDLVDAFGPARGYWRRRAKLYRERGWK